MSMMADVTKSIIENVDATNLTKAEKIELATNLFKNITEDLGWLDFDDPDDVEMLEIFTKQL